MNNLLTGFSFLGQGFSLIRQPGLRRFALMPVLINVTLFAGLGWWLWHQFGIWLDGLPLLDRWGDIWFFSAIRSVIRFLFGVTLFLISLFSFTVIANLIAAPFNSLLAEQVEGYLTGTTPPTQNLSTLLSSIPTTLWSEIRKLIYLCLWLVPIALLYLVPILQLIAPLLTLLFGAWIFAIEYLDYPLGNHGKGFKAVRQIARRHRGASIGFGLAVTIMTAIPILNLIVMPVAVAGATALSLKLADF